MDGLCLLPSVYPSSLVHSDCIAFDEYLYAHMRTKVNTVSLYDVVVDSCSSSSSHSECRVVCEKATNMLEQCEEKGLPKGTKAKARATLGARCLRLRMVRVTVS